MTTGKGPFDQQQTHIAVLVTAAAAAVVVAVFGVVMPMTFNEIVKTHSCSSTFFLLHSLFIYSAFMHRLRAPCCF